MYRCLYVYTERIKLNSQTSVFNIDRRSKLPLYELIAQNLRELIRSNELSPDVPIPSEIELAEIYRVSRMTVRRAMDELVRQGWIYRQRGIGTFVRRTQVTHIVLSKLSFTEQMRAIGRNPSSRMVSIQSVPASPQVASRLNLSSGEPVAEIVRVRLADGDPILLETAYLSLARFPGLDQATDLETGSLYAYLESHYGVSVVTMVQSLEPVLLSADQALHLGAKPGTPAIRSEIISFGRNDRPIEYSWSVSSGEKCKFYFRFQRGEKAEDLFQG